ncbi:TolC family protein [Treponema primitia]|uniref:TolC family protein n=1 Tax=Treponema primitia TaxID=88058 RepID=UPI0002554CAE|nr:TolC family protein [Treponema primitia]
MKSVSLCGFLALFLLISASPVSSQESSPPIALNLDRAVELAQENSIDLQKRFIDLSNAEYAANRLWSELFPGISTSLGLSYGTPLFSGDGFQGSSDNLNYTASMGLSFQLNSTLSPAMRITKLDYQTSLLAYENARRVLGIGISGTFYSLIAEKEKLSLLEGTRKLAEQQLEKSRTSFRNGMIGELGYLQSQLSAETAHLDLSRAEASYADNLGKFLVLLGLDQNTPVILEGEIAITRLEAETEDLIREHLSSRPDIIRARQEIEKLELVELQKTRNGRAPSLSLAGRWQGDSSGNDINENFSDRLSGSLTLSIPLESWIPGTKANQTIRTANTDIEKARLDLKNTENEAMTAIRSLTTNLRNSWGNIEISQLRVQLAERTYELTEQGFRNGAVESLVLEDSRNEMTKARQQLLDDRLAYKKMMLELSSALNINEADLVRSMP